MCADALPPIMFQTDVDGKRRAMYMLTEDSDGITGRWTCDSSDRIHQLLNEQIKQALTKARGAMVRRSRQEEDDDIKEKFAKMGLAFGGAEKKCDKESERKLIIANLRIKSGVMSNNADGSQKN
jgi:hypothetical protein